MCALTGDEHGCGDDDGGGVSSAKLTADRGERMDIEVACARTGVAQIRRTVLPSLSECAWILTNGGPIPDRVGQERSMIATRGVNGDYGCRVRDREDKGRNGS